MSAASARVSETASTPAPLNLTTAVVPTTVALTPLDLNCLILASERAIPQAVVVCGVLIKATRLAREAAASEPISTSPARAGAAL